MAIRLQSYIFFLLIGSSLVIGGCATTKDHVTGESTYNSFTLEEDIELGEKIKNRNISALRQEGILLNEDKKMVAKLENIVRVLGPITELPDLPYNVTLVQAPDIVNASAAPGGSILVYEGLYHPENGLVKTDDELAAVLAHEIGHVTARHGTEQLSKSKAVKTTGAVVSTILNVALSVVTESAGVGDLAGDLFDTAYGAGAALWFPSYNRKQEAEADKLSMIYLARAGINPQAAIDIWERSASKSKDKKNSIFASHPTDENRFKALEKFLPEAMAIYDQTVTTQSGE